MTDFHMPALGSSDVLTRASGPLPGLADRFSELMKDAPQPLPADGEPTRGVGQVLIEQDGAVRKMMGEMRQVTDDIATGNSAMNTAVQMRMLVQMTSVNVHFQACSYLGQSVKNGVQTLMRNQ